MYNEKIFCLCFIIMFLSSKIKRKGTTQFNAFDMFAILDEGVQLGNTSMRLLQQLENDYS